MRGCRAKPGTFNLEEQVLADSAAGEAHGRRDFLYVATGAVGVVTTAAAVWPLIDQMNPDASILALASIEVDVTDVEPGMQITVKWRGKPVFIRRRTSAEIEEARAVAVDELRDEDSRNANLPDGSPALDSNRAIDEAGEWLVMVGVCTHLGCVPIGEGAGEYGGWFCPCHGSHYDSSGRIRKGPAPENLQVPLAAFVRKNLIRLG